MKIGIYAVIVVKQKRLLRHHGKTDAEAHLQRCITINFVVKQATIIKLAENVMPKFISSKEHLLLLQDVVLLEVHIPGIINNIMKYKFLAIIILSSLGVYYSYPEKQNSGIKITSIEVYKSKHKMYLYSNNNVVHTYSISLGGNPIGKKTKEGDQKTPEGKYIIDAKNDKSSFYKNLGISYPNASDKANHYTGGLIKIHGLRNGFGWVGKFHRLYDWTNGCIALTNQEMKTLYNTIEIGTPIYIYP
jgi:hypothetical protein